MRREASIVSARWTGTGQAQATRLCPAATVTYFPLDFSVAVKRFLEHHRPRLFAAMETEIWPNATRLAAARGMRLVLANGRISDRSFPRYRMARPIVARVLRHYDAILAREAQDAERFRAIGAEGVEVAGNVKFDYVPDERPLDFDLLALAAGRPIVVLGSTMEGEDEALLPEVLPLGAFVVVAPRKPERFDVVAGMLSGKKFVRRSVTPSVSEGPGRAGGAPPHGRAGTAHGRGNPRRRGTDGAAHRRTTGVTILLKPFELLWRGVNRFRRALYRRGVLKAKRLPKPVISVGSITAGGAGKTPATIAIGEYLIARGWRVAVLTRGYKRSGAGGRVTEPDAAKFGDEPGLLTRIGDVIVWSNRYEKGVQVKLDGYFLDDGFQPLRPA